jgi:outer membrane receptor protein involved in Fe transport
MTKNLLSFLLILSFLNVHAQVQDKQGKGEISGRVIDSAINKPLEYATITMYKQENKKPVNGALTDKDGHFIIKNIRNGVYRLVVESINHTSRSFNNIIIEKGDEHIELNGILLRLKSVNLQNITIKMPTRLIENKIDKMVFNADKDITSQTGAATDVLKKVPMVSVDVDGNVELAGSSSIRFLINGKPSEAFGSNITDVLQSIPASEIKSIEVITNPGAKYDAEGMGGIINIILKDNRAKGVNGNLSLTAGTRDENGSFNFNARKGTFGLNAFISGHYHVPVNAPSSSDRLTTDTINKTDITLQQDALSSLKRHGMQSGLGFDWTLKKKNNFTGSVHFGNFGFASNGYTNQLQTTIAQNGGSLLSSIASLNYTNDVFSFHNTDASLNYKRTFTKEDEELDIGVNTSHNNDHGTASNSQLMMPEDSLYYGTSSLNPGKENETEITVDYSDPFKNGIVFNTGGKIIFSDIISHSDISSFEPGTKLYEYNTALSNYLDYKQRVYAYYSELAFPVGKLFNAKIGGRYERTQLDAFYSNAQQQSPAHGYNTFVPSVFLSRNLNDNETIKLSYSKRIERPDYRDLNPFINTTDPKNISTGNPYLDPEIGHRIEFGYNRNFANNGSFMISAFYRINDHDIQPYIVFYPSLTVGDSTYTNVNVSTRQNIGKEKNFGLDLFADIHFTDKFSIRTNGFAFYRHTINAIDPAYNYSSFNYRINMNVTYQFAKNLVAEFFGRFRSPRHEAQGRYPSFTSYDMALRKQFWNKKASIALTAVNPFGKYVNQRTKLFGPNFTINGYRQIPFRSFGINFSWKFGKLEFKKDKPTNTSEDNSGGGDMPQQ